MKIKLLISTERYRVWRESLSNIYSFAFQNDEFEEIVQTSDRLEKQYGQYFDQIIINEDLQKAVNELRLAVHNLETEPQWVPASWVR